MAENSDEELEALRVEMQQKVDERNHTPLDDFSGLTPEQMHTLFYDPWSESSPVIWQASEEAADMPLRHALVTVLEYFSGPKGAKLTPQGRLPRKLLTALHELHAWDPIFHDRFPHMEEDSRVATMMHALVRHEGFVRKQHGHYLLTRKGRDWLARDPADQAGWIMQFSSQVFNWAYLDGHAELSEFQMGWPFLLWLVLQYGHEQRPVSFYTERILRAWPWLLDELEDHPYRTREAQFDSICSVRGFQRWLGWLGFVFVERERFPEAEVMVQATPLLKQCWALRN